MSDAYVFICTRNTPSVSIPTRVMDVHDLTRRVANAFAQLSGGFHTAGHLRLRPTGDAINDHLLCDGSEISRTQFSELFAYLGTQYGEGDGATTFNLPNFLGQALAVPETAPAQAPTEGGTIVSEGQVITMPINEGRTRGGNVRSGGRHRKLPQ